ncbi:MAG: hypothetical protein AAF125_11705, partial [Chloroflexota bacterium]
TVIPILEQLIPGATANQLRAIISALGYIGGHQALTIISRYVGDRNSFHSARDALQHLDSPAARKLLLIGAYHHDFYTRMGGFATALIDAVTPETYKHLMPLLYQDPLEVGIADLVLDALVRVGATDASDAVMHIMGGDYPVSQYSEAKDVEALRYKAADVLEQLGTPAEIAAARNWREAQQALAPVVFNVLDQVVAMHAIPDIVRIMRDDLTVYQFAHETEVSAIRERAAQALEQIGTPEALAALAAWREANTT